DGHASRCRPHLVGVDRQVMELALAVRDVLLVPRCAGCGEPGSWFCVSCRDGCEPVAHDGHLALRAAGAHAGPLRAAVRRLKYGGEPGLAEDLGSLVALELARDLARGVTIDVIVPVPLSETRPPRRGPRALAPYALMSWRSRNDALSLARARSSALGARVRQPQRHSGRRAHAGRGSTGPLVSRRPSERALRVDGDQ